MSDFVNDLFRRKREQAEREAAASGKEPFDMARLDELLGEAGDRSIPDEAYLRENYYVAHPEMHTLGEFAELRKMLWYWEDR